MYLYTYLFIIMCIATTLFAASFLIGSSLEICLDRRCEVVSKFDIVKESDGDVWWPVVC